MTGPQLTLSLAIILAAFGLLWVFLSLRETGPLTAIERLGLHIAAWARAQKWAKERRKEEYKRLRDEHREIGEMINVSN